MPGVTRASAAWDSPGIIWNAHASSTLDNTSSPTGQSAAKEYLPTHLNVFSYFMKIVDEPSRLADVRPI